MCQHSPLCPPADAADRDAAKVVSSHPEQGWSLLCNGVVSFDDAPPPGAEVRAGFLFDVPVRFAEDRLQVSGAAFAAGEAPAVPLVELREAS